MRITATGFGWRHAGRKNPALEDLNFQIETGEKVLVLGPSGAGKSTLLAGLAGVLGDDQDGERAGHLTIGEHDPRQRKGLVGMVLQDPDSQVISSRVGDDVVFGCENLGVAREEMWHRATEALHLVGLDLPLDHPTAQLSGGQKQRLALAGVLAMQPAVIVLDEPTANLDPAGAEAVKSAVLRAATATGATLIVVEHNVATWAPHMDRVLVIDNHTITADGPAQHILHHHAEELSTAGMWIPGIPLDITPLETQPTEQKVVECDQLGVGWNQKIQQVTHTITSGSTVLTGANGTGKTTTALTIAGLLPPQSGRVRYPDYRGAPHRWRSTALVQRVGYVFQDPEHQFMTRSVREELELGPRLAGQPAERTDELLDQLRLRHLAHANPHTLSGGEKRRLSVATMLATAPRLLIVDEPTFGQDRNTFTAMVQLLRAHVERGTALLSISHSAEYLRLMSHHHWELT